MRTHDEIEAELNALGWKVTVGPSRTSTGWKATMQRSNASGSVQMTGWTKLSLLENMLLHAQERARKP